MKAIIAVAVVLYLFCVVAFCKAMAHVTRETTKPRDTKVKCNHTNDTGESSILKHQMTTGVIWLFCYRCYFHSERETYYRCVVEVAGGQYVGIQEGVSEGVKNDGLVLFNSPKTGSTLAVKEKDFTAVVVENRLKHHEHKWGH
jgi:hypothetical protein